MDKNLEIKCYDRIQVDHKIACGLGEGFLSVLFYFLSANSPPCIYAMDTAANVCKHLIKSNKDENVQKFAFQIEGKKERMNDRKKVIQKEIERKTNKNHDTKSVSQKV